jgi:hypothetical protein
MFLCICNFNLEKGEYTFLPAKEIIHTDESSHGCTRKLDGIKVMQNEKKQLPATCLLEITVYFS